MDFMTAMDVSSSALTAQRTRMNVISANLANINTTRTSEGGPYKRKVPIFTATPAASASFEDSLRKAAGGGVERVDVTNIREDNRDFKVIFDPAHPDADDLGYVYYPNINVMEEMVHMLTAKRSYEASVTAFNATKSMALKSLDLLR